MKFRMQSLCAQKTHNKIRKFHTHKSELIKRTSNGRAGKITNVFSCVESICAFEYVCVCSKNQFWHLFISLGSTHFPCAIHFVFVLYFYFFEIEILFMFAHRIESGPNVRDAFYLFV